MKKYSGFSLVELLVVIAIIAILSAVSWRTLGDAKKSSSVTDACNMVAGAINEYRNAILAGHISGGDSNDEVSFDPGSLELPKGVSCSGMTNIKYKLPYGEMESISDIICQNGSYERKVQVTFHRASCE